VAVGVFDLLSLELELLELAELLAVLPALVLASLEVLLSPGEELVLPLVLSVFLASPFVSLATALLLPWSVL
jgi:hypothetical protein